MFRTAADESYLIGENESPLGAYLNIPRIIELAKERILEGVQTVSQVAYELGFQYPQHFSRLFKKHVGCTPNEYKQKN